MHFQSCTTCLFTPCLQDDVQLGVSAAQGRKGPGNNSPEQIHQPLASAREGAGRGRQWGRGGHIPRDNRRGGTGLLQLGLARSTLSVKPQPCWVRGRREAALGSSKRKAGEHPEERCAPAPAGEPRAHRPPGRGTEQVQAPLVTTRELQWRSSWFAVLCVSCVCARTASPLHSGFFQGPRLTLVNLGGRGHSAYPRMPATLCGDLSGAEQGSPAAPAGWSSPFPADGDQYGAAFWALRLAGLRLPSRLLGTTSSPGTAASSSQGLLGLGACRTLVLGNPRAAGSTRKHPLQPVLARPPPHQRCLRWHVRRAVGLWCLRRVAWLSGTMPAPGAKVWHNSPQVGTNSS